MTKSLAVFTEKNADYLRVMNRFLKGFEYIKLLRVKEFFLGNYKKNDIAIETSREKYTFVTSFAQTSGVLFGNLAQVGCLSVGLYFVLKGELTVGLLIFQHSIF